MKKWFVLICILLCMVINSTVFANSQSDFTENIVDETVDIKDLNRYTKEITKDLNDDITFENILEKIENNEFDISIIVNFIIQQFFSEIKDVIIIFIGIFSVMVISGILKSVTSSFSEKSVGEIGFYVCYMIVILSICNVFYTGSKIASETIQNMYEFLKITIPIFITLAISGGNIGEGVVIAPFIGGMGAFVIGFILSVIVPITVTVSVFEIINYISERELLKSLISFMKKCISMLLKGIAILFTAILSIQKLAIPAVSGVALKTTKAVAGAIPVVGDIMEGTMESTVALITAAKGSISVVVIIFLILMCLIPILKLFTVFIMYKLIGVFSEPFCDKRLIGCMDCVADFTYILLGAIVTTGVIFVFSVIVMVSSGIL